MGQFVMAVPPVLLELCEKYHDKICRLQFFPGNVEITEIDDVGLVGRCVTVSVLSIQCW